MKFFNLLHKRYKNDGIPIIKLKNLQVKTLNRVKKKIEIVQREAEKEIIEGGEDPTSPEGEEALRLVKEGVLGVMEILNYYQKKSAMAFIIPLSFARIVD